MDPVLQELPLLQWSMLEAAHSFHWHKHPRRTAAVHSPDDSQGAHQGKVGARHILAGLSIHTAHNHPEQIQAEPVHMVKTQEVSGPAVKAAHKHSDHNHLAVSVGYHSQIAV
jgi:hypothetical protein